MDKKKKIWLTVGIVLTLLGAIIFACVTVAAKGDYTKLSMGKYVSKEYEIEENYENISIVTDTADVVFAAAENGETKVVCVEEENAKHTVNVVENTLVIELQNERKWYENWFNFKSPKITVYMPQTARLALKVQTSSGDVTIPKDFQFESMEVLGNTGDVVCEASAFGEINIQRSTGDIRLSNISAKALTIASSTGDVEISNATFEESVDITVTTGDVSLQNVACKNLISNGDTGEVEFTNVIATEKFLIKRSTGDVTLKKCDGLEITIETDTGDVTGSLLSAKTFDVKTDTGDVKIPADGNGGVCKITTDTGDIKIVVE